MNDILLLILVNGSYTVINLVDSLKCTSVIDFIGIFKDLNSTLELEDSVKKTFDHSYDKAEFVRNVVKALQLYVANQDEHPVFNLEVKVDSHHWAKVISIATKTECSVKIYTSEKN